MEKYEIIAYYQTGDSFTEYETETTVEYKWEDIEKAKESLKRIKDHYELYSKTNSLWEKPDFELPIGCKWDEEYGLLTLSLVSDDGEEFGYWPDWCGYFEVLHAIKIQIASNGNNDTEYNFY